MTVMSGEPDIRLAVPADAEAMLQIYGPVIEETAISFEAHVPSLEEFASRIARTLEKYPWICACRDGQLLGYAYAGEHRARAAYAWSAETSVYVSAAAQGTGIGTLLYQNLFEGLIQLGYVNAYAGTTLPNEASERLHRRCRFEPIGVFRRIGYKFGAWHDVAWWHRPLTIASDRPLPPPRMLSEVSDFPFKSP